MSGISDLVCISQELWCTLGYKDKNVPTNYTGDQNVISKKKKKIGEIKMSCNKTNRFGFRFYRNDEDKCLCQMLARNGILLPKLF